MMGSPAGTPGRGSVPPMTRAPPGEGGGLSTRTRGSDLRRLLRSVTNSRALWRGGALPRRAARRAAMAAEVARLFRAHHGTYGSPRITADLRDAGWQEGVNPVAALMRDQHLAARRKKRRRSLTRPGKGRWRAQDPVPRDLPPGGGKSK